MAGVPTESEADGPETDAIAGATLVTSVVAESLPVALLASVTTTEKAYAPSSSGVTAIELPLPFANGAPFFVTVHAYVNEASPSMSVTVAVALIAVPSADVDGAATVTDGASLTECTVTCTVAVAQSEAVRPAVLPLSQTSYEKLAGPW